jgi:HSP20 family protein
MERALNRRWRGFSGAEAEAWRVPVDVVEDGQQVEIRASLSGIEPEKIEVTVEDGVLTIRAETTTEDERRDGAYLMRERRTGSFSRTLRLPDTLDTEKARTHYGNGVLSIIFPRVEAKKAKQLKIEVGDRPQQLKDKKAA